MDLKEFEDILFSSFSYGKEEPIRIHHKSYDPRPPSMRNTTQLDLDELVEELESLPVSSGFVYLLKKPSALDKSNSSLPLITRSIQARIREVIKPGLDSGLDFGLDPIAIRKLA